MLVKLASGETFHVTWRYEPNKFGDTVDTRCLVSKIDPADKTKKELLVEGKAECSWKDQFDKNVGRKISLSRALITRIPKVPEPTPENPQIWEPVFPREQRHEFWTEYFHMRKGKFE